MTRTQLATHEAGHTVVAMALHIPVEAVTIDDIDGRCIVSPPNRWSRLLVDLGGPLAERLVLGRAVATSPRDLVVFLSYPIAKRREACAVTLGILRRRVGLVEAVAEALAKAGRLDAQRLAELEADWNRGHAPYLGGAFLGS